MDISGTHEKYIYIHIVLSAVFIRMYVYVNI